MKNHLFLWFLDLKYRPLPKRVGLFDPKGGVPAAEFPLIPFPLIPLDCDVPTGEPDFAAPLIEFPTCATALAGNTNNPTIATAIRTFAI
jgi:hypothetical protein